MFFENEPTKEQSLNVTLSKRQASLFVAGGFFLVFIIFMTGYFWGKSNAITQFCMSVEQSTFADRIYTSMCELSETEASPLQAVAQNTEVQPESVTALDAEPEVEQIDQVESIDPNGEPRLIEVQAPTKTSESYHAQLAGYGTLQQAQIFAQKLCKKNIPAKVETKKSKSTKGKTRSWYQVITQDFTNKEELESLVARVSKEEKLRGVRIVRS